jgi:cell division septation protein DedD
MSKASSAAAPAQPMTFYKSVEQKTASADLTPPADTKTDATAAPATPAQANGASANGTPGNGTSPSAPASTAADPATVLPASSSYFVQVAAVSKQEDADALVDALKKKDYPAFVAAQSATDKLFRVQLGPFGDVKDAEAMRTKLVGDGYSPILKK